MIITPNNPVNRRLAQGRVQYEDRIEEAVTKHGSRLRRTVDELEADLKRVKELGRREVPAYAKQVRILTAAIALERSIEDGIEEHRHTPGGLRARLAELELQGRDCSRAVKLQRARIREILAEEAQGKTDQDQAVGR